MLFTNVLDNKRIEYNFQAIKMIKSIKKAMEQEIVKSNWMTSNTKAFAKAKLENIVTLIGYPDWYKNKTILQQAYDGVSRSHFLSDVHS